MPRKSKKLFSAKDLTKGEQRKLTALRKSLGDEIADRAFAEWLETQAVAPEPVDKNAEMIADAVQKLRESKGLRIPRGGYRVTSGRGRTIVELLDGQ